MDDYASQLDSDVTAALGILAPTITKTKHASTLPIAKWINREAIVAKRLSRKLERKFRRTGLQGDFSEWKRAGRASVKVLNSARLKYLTDTLNNCSSVPSKRWKTIRNILHNSNKCFNNCLFNAQMFCDFFERKLTDIQSSVVLDITSISRFLFRHLRHLFCFQVFLLLQLLRHLFLFNL